MAVSWAQIRVSTHSRPKAAGDSWHQYQDAFLCFNTQPPEGGWKKPLNISVMSVCFNTQPPEGGWASGGRSLPRLLVSTHSRPKAAGGTTCTSAKMLSFQHTAARRRLGDTVIVRAPEVLVSTHSRPKAAGTTCHATG